MDCDRAGVFRGTITECGLFEAESGAKAINIVASLDEIWDAEAKEWCPWSEYQMQAKGAIWLIKKGGEVNTKAVESAVKCANWCGSLEEAANGVFSQSPKACQFSVTEEAANEYHKEVQYRIAFLNDYDRTPGAAGNVTPERAKALQAQYGSQFRALGGNVTRNAAAPAKGKPKPPVAAKKNTPQKPFPDPNADPNAMLDEAARENDEIAPF